MYLDGTEDPPKGSVPPAWCPQCRGKLTTLWAPQVRMSRGRGSYVVAAPWHVCETCKIGVRVFTLPAKPLRTTRKAATAEGKKELKRLRSYKFR